MVQLADGTVVHVFDLAMPVRFRGVERRQGLLVDGPAGWAEFSPFLDYDDAECVPWWDAALTSAIDPWPDPVRSSIPVNCTVPIVSAEDAGRLVRDSGCRTAKVKVADPDETLDDDVQRVVAVREAIGPDGHVRVDANGAWDVETAVRSIRVLDDAAGLEYVEQPCADVENLAAVRRRVDVRIAADESIRRAEDPYRVRDLEAADVAVLKVQPLGGVGACLRIAEEIGLPVVVSSAVESSVGLAAGLALAAALPELPHACGLATTSLLAADVVSTPLRPVDGHLPVGRVGPDAAALAAAAADEETQVRWLERVERVRALARGRR